MMGRGVATGRLSSRAERSHRENVWFIRPVYLIGLDLAAHGVLRQGSPIIITYIGRSFFLSKSRSWCRTLRAYSIFSTPISLRADTERHLSLRASVGTAWIIRRGAALCTTQKFDSTGRCRKCSLGGCGDCSRVCSRLYGCWFGSCALEFRGLVGWRRGSGLMASGYGGGALMAQSRGGWGAWLVSQVWGGWGHVGWSRGGCFASRALRASGKFTRLVVWRADFKRHLSLPTDIGTAWVEDGRTGSDAAAHTWGGIEGWDAVCGVLDSAGGVLVASYHSGKAN